MMKTLLPALLTVALVGCDGPLTCDPPEEDYDVDYVLTQGELDQEGDDCEHLCRYAYSAETGWFADTVEGCVLDVTPQEGADPATEVGSVTCSVHGYEHYCA